MKIDITLKDLTKEEAATVVSQLGISGTGTQTVVKPQIESPAAQETPQAEQPTAPQIESPVDPVTPAAPTATSDVEVDSEGYPWDKRIHSGNKKQKADGTWSRRRNVDDETWNSVRAELKAAQAPAMPTNPVDTEQPAAPAMPEQPAAPAAHVPGNVPMPDPAAAQAPIPPATPPMPEQPAAPAAAAQSPVQQPAPPAQQPAAPAAQTGDFNALLSRIQTGMQSGTVDPNYMNTVIAELNTQFNVQLGAITDIMTNQPMIDAAFAILVRDGK